MVLTADVYTGGGMVVATSSAATQINLKKDIIVNDIMRISSEKAARTLTIDLCGNEIYSTQSGGYVFLVSGCSSNFKTVWNDIDLTVKNGTVDGEVKYWAYIFDIRSAKESSNVKITIEDLICIGQCGMYANGTGGGAKIVATNCSFPTGVYLPANNTYEFTNCYFAGEAGAYLKSGNYTFTKCTFKGEGAHYDPVNYDGSGQSSSGAGLAIDSCATYIPNLNVILEDCTFSSVYGCGIFEFITKPKESDFNTAYSSITFKGKTTFGPCGTAYYISSNGKINNDIILAEDGSSLVKVDADGNPILEQILTGGGL